MIKDNFVKYQVSYDATISQIMMVMKEDVGGGTQRRHRTTLKVTTRKSAQLLSKANPTIRNGPGNLGATVTSLPTCPKILKIKLEDVGTEV